MLQRLREKTQGWIAGIIIGILILSMALWGISYYMHGSSASSDVVVKFNGGEVTLPELDTAFNRFKLQNSDKVSNTPAATKLLKQQLLDQLITQKLLAAAAKQSNLLVGQEQINSVLLQIPAFQSNGQFSQAQFEGVLNQLLFTPAEFLENLQDTMLINQLQSGVMGSVFVLPDEVSNAALLINQQRQFSYAILSKDRVINQIQINNTDIEEYYKQHQEDFMLPEKVGLQYVVLSAAEIMKKIVPTASQLLQFYQANLNNYTQPVRWQVAHILLADDQAQALKIVQEAKNGANFSSLANQYSQDPLTAKKGGILPWFTQGQVDPAFEAATASLKKGEISSPVKTKYGYEIIKLLQVQPQQAIPYAQVSAKVREAYLLQTAQKQFEDQKEQLSNLSFENPNSLKSAADTLHLPLQITQNFTNEGGTESLTKLPQVITAAFSQDVLDGNNSDVITIAPGQVAVIRILSHQPASVIPLSQVSSRVRQLLVDSAVKEKLTTLGDQIIEAMVTGQTEAQVAKTYHLTWQNVTAELTAKNINMAILNAAYSLARPVPLHPSVGGVSLANNDYALVNLNAIVYGKGLAAAQQNALNQQLAQGFRQAESLEYIEYLREKAKVKNEN